MTAIAIIPARGGSRRIPRKNIRSFHGKPIIAYSIQAAFSSGLFDQLVYVSTDDEEIAQIARQYGAGILMRSKSMAADDIGTQDVTADALNAARGANDPEWTDDDYACCIYPCALISPLMLIQARQVLEAMPEKHYVYAIGDDHYDAGQYYFGRARSFLRGVPLDGNSVERLIDGAIDINTPEDFARAEAAYAEMQKVTT